MQSYPAVEVLETRVLLSGTSPEITGLQLVNDTGTPGDFVTNDPRISGTLIDTDSSSHDYVVEIDVNNDGFLEDAFSVSPGSVFQYDLSGYVSPGELTVAVRGREYDHSLGEYVYGSWETLTFEYIPPYNAPPEITGLSASGTSITGTLTDSDSSSYYYQVQVDLHADGTIDDWISVSAGYPFQYQIPGSVEAGEVTVAFRGVEYDYYYGRDNAGERETLTFEYTPPYNAPTEITDLSFSETTVTGTLIDPDSSRYDYSVQVDLYGDGSIDQWIWVSGGGPFQYQLPNTVTAGDVTVAFRGVEYDNYYQTSLYGAWSEITFDYVPPYNPPPVIADLTASDTGITGKLTDPGTSGGSYQIEVDLHGDGTTDAWLNVSSGSLFSYQLPDSISAGDVTVAFRGREYDNFYATYVYGTWETVTFAFEPPQITGLQGSGDTITGTLIDPNSSGAAYQVQVDLGGNGSIDDWIWVSAGIPFRYELPQSVSAGELTVAFRGVEFDQSYGRSASGSWTSTTFDYVPSSTEGDPGGWFEYGPWGGPISWTPPVEGASNHNGANSGSSGSGIPIDFLKERQSPNLELPFLGQVPDAPEINLDLASQLKDIPRYQSYSYGPVSNQTTIGTRSWSDSFGSYVETTSLLTTTERTGTPSYYGGDWALQEILTATWSVITTFSDGLGESWTLEQSGSRTQTFTGVVDYGSNSVAIGWSLTTSFLDSYVFTRSVDTEKTDAVSGDVTTRVITDSRSGTQPYSLTAQMQRTVDYTDGAMTSFYSNATLTSALAESHLINATQSIAAPSGLSLATTTSSAAGSSGWQLELSSLEDWSPSAVNRMTSHFEYDSHSADSSVEHELIDWDETVSTTVVSSGSGMEPGSGEDPVSVDVSTRTVRSRLLHSETQSQSGFHYSGSLTKQTGTADTVFEGSYTATGSESETSSDVDGFHTIVSASTADSTVTVDTHSLSSDVLQSESSILDAWGERDGNTGAARYETSGSGTSASMASITVHITSSDDSISGTVKLLTSDQTATDTSSRAWTDHLLESENFVGADRISVWSTTSSESGSIAGAALASSLLSMTMTSVTDQITTTSTSQTASQSSTEEWELESASAGTETRLIAPGVNAVPWSSTETSSYSDERSGTKSSTTTEVVLLSILPVATETIALTLTQRDSRQNGGSFSWNSAASGSSSGTNTEIPFDSNENGTIEAGESKYDSTYTSEDHESETILDGTNWWSNESVSTQTVRLSPSATKTVVTESSTSSQETGSGTWTDSRGRDDTYSSTYVSTTLDGWEHSTEVESSGSDSRTSHGWVVTTESQSGSYSGFWDSHTTMLDFPTERSAIRSISHSREEQNNGQLSSTANSTVHSYEDADGTSQVTEVSLSSSTRSHDLSLLEESTYDSIDRNRSLTDSHRRDRTVKTGTRTISAAESRNLVINGSLLSDSTNAPGDGDNGPNGEDPYWDWGYWYGYGAYGDGGAMSSVVEKEGIRYVTIGTSSSSFSDVEVTAIVADQVSWRTSSYVSIDGQTVSGSANLATLILPEWVEEPNWNPLPSGSGWGSGDGNEEEEEDDGTGDGSEPPVENAAYSRRNQQLSIYHAEGTETRSDLASQSFSYLASGAVTASAVTEQSVVSALLSSESLSNEQHTLTRGEDWTHDTHAWDRASSTSDTQISTLMRDESEIFADGRYWSQSTFRDAAQTESAFTTEVENITSNKTYTAIQNSATGTTSQERISEVIQAKGWGIPLSDPDATEPTWFNQKIEFESDSQISDSTFLQTYQFVSSQQTGGNGRESVSGNSFSIGITLEATGTQRTEDESWTRRTTGTHGNDWTQTNLYESYGRLFEDGTETTVTEFGVDIAFASADVSGSIILDFELTQIHSLIKESVWENGTLVQKDYTDSLQTGTATNLTLSLQGSDFLFDYEWHSLDGQNRYKDGTLTEEIVHGTMSQSMTSRSYAEADLWNGFYSQEIITTYDDHVGSYEFTRQPGYAWWTGTRTSFNVIPYDYSRIATSTTSSTTHYNGEVSHWSSSQTNTSTLNSSGVVSIHSSNTDSYSEGSSNTYDYEDSFSNTPAHNRVDQSLSLPSPDSLVSQALSPFNYYHLPMIPNAVYDGLAQWNGYYGGMMGEEYQLHAAGYDADGSYFQYFIGNESGDWYVHYYTHDPAAGGTYLRSEAGSQHNHPFSGLYTPLQWLNNDLRIQYPDETRYFAFADSRPQYGEPVSDPAYWWYYGPQQNPDLDDAPHRDAQDKLDQMKGQIAQAGGDDDLLHHLPAFTLVPIPNGEVKVVDPTGETVGWIILKSGEVRRQLGGVTYYASMEAVFQAMGEHDENWFTSQNWNEWFQKNGSTQSKDQAAAYESLKRIWEAQKRIGLAQSELLSRENQLRQELGSQFDPNHPNLKVLRTLYLELLAEQDHLISSLSGTAANGPDAIGRMELTEKFQAAIQKAIQSGRLSHEVSEKMKSMLTTEAIGSTVALLTIYAALHASPAAPFVVVVDAGMVASGGAEVGLALQQIYLEISSATSERELDEAANHLADTLAGPIADQVVSVLTRRAAKVGVAGGKTFHANYRINVIPPSQGKSVTLSMNLAGQLPKITITKRTDELLDGAKGAVRGASRKAEFFDELATAATRNADRTKLVLGKWNTPGQSYQNVAAHYNATYFKLEDWRVLSKTLSDAELWKINEVFLRQQIKQGKQIILSHDPTTATGFFKNEVDFLSNFYRFEKDGWVWKAIPK